MGGFRTGHEGVGSSRCRCLGTAKGPVWVQTSRRTRGDNRCTDFEKINDPKQLLRAGQDDYK
jgi:hypothetical protein